MRKIYSALNRNRLSSFVLLVSFFCFFNSSKLNAQSSGTHLSYDGVDDYTTLGNNIVQGLTGDYTIEAWIYWKGGAAFQRIFDFGTTGDPFTSPWIFFTPDGGSGNPRFAISTNGLGTPQVVDATSAFPQNTWTHFAVVYTQGTNTLDIYINGTNVGSGPVSISPSALGSTTENWLGRSQFVAPWVGTDDPYFNGEIDEFRISNVARYTTTPFTPQTTEFSNDPSTTIALFHFDEGTGTTTADATAHGFDGTLAASPSTPTWVTGSILPIKLASVSATLVNNNAVDIKWSASLDRESEFVIERSNNGSAFSAIGTISHIAGTNSFETFTFRDSKPLSGRSYYRLKCTETGSASFYSKMVVIVISAKQEFIVYPNPVKNSFITVELPKPYTGNIDFTISSTSGAVVLKKNINAIDTKEFQLPKTTSFVPGAYLLEITTNGVKQSKVIIYQ